jgi:acetyl esterase/lipase
MRTFAYGDHPDQFCELRGDGGPTVVLVHGGFWRAKYRLDLMYPIADDLEARGWTTWNVEFRRVGAGGGFPETFGDVAAACHVARTRDLGPLIALGHSAGGHLSLWLAGEGFVDAAVSLAGVCCLVDASQEWLGNRAADELMRGAPSESTWARADPVQRLPTGKPTVLVHGSNDKTVPISQSRKYADAAQLAGDDCELIAFRGGHFPVIEPGSQIWPTIVDRLERLRLKLTPPVPPPSVSDAASEL